MTNITILHYNEDKEAQMKSIFFSLELFSTINFLVTLKNLQNVNIIFHIFSYITWEVYLEVSLYSDEINSAYNFITIMSCIFTVEFYHSLKVIYRKISCRTTIEFRMEIFRGTKLVHILSYEIRWSVFSIPVGNTRTF